MGSACALLGDGALKCWGANGSGQLGNASTIASAVPVDVVGLSSGVVAVAPGEYHTCAVTETGAVMCWGNYLGGYSVVPVDVKF
jgi:hypothetical protein